jgi:hypothetical protein
MDMKKRSEPTSLETLVESYLIAKGAIIELGYAGEIDWQSGLNLASLTERDFLREAAWVIVASGIREAVVRKKFTQLSNAFYGFRSGRIISRNRERCRSKAMEAFRHSGKIEAILAVASEVASRGFREVKLLLATNAIEYIKTLPYLGPATSFHLAKNIGLDVVKPDRHLLRVAEVVGYPSPQQLCEAIASAVGDRICVVDLVIWRFATIFPNYTSHFESRGETLVGPARAA